MTNIIDETVMAKQKDMEEEFGMQFMTQLISNSNQANDMMSALMLLIKLAENRKK